MGKLWHLGFDIIVQPWFPQYGIECQDIENENEIQKQNYEIHLRLDFTQFRIYFQDILIKKGIYMITAIDLFFFSGGRWEYVWMGEFGEMDNYRWGDINMSGGHYFMIINIMISICQVVTIM